MIQVIWQSQLIAKKWKIADSAWIENLQQATATHRGCVQLSLMEKWSYSFCK